MITFLTFIFFHLILNFELYKIILIKVDFFSFYIGCFIKYLIYLFFIFTLLTLIFSLFFQFLFIYENMFLFLEFEHMNNNIFQKTNIYSKLINISNQNKLAMDNLLDLVNEGQNANNMGDRPVRNGQIPLLPVLDDNIENQNINNFHLRPRFQFFRARRQAFFLEEIFWEIWETFFPRQ